MDEWNELVKLATKQPFFVVKDGGGRFTLEKKRKPVFNGSFEECRDFLIESGMGLAAPQDFNRLWGLCRARDCWAVPVEGGMYQIERHHAVLFGPASFEETEAWLMRQAVKRGH